MNVKKPSLNLLLVLAVFATGILYGVGSVFSASTAAQGSEPLPPQELPVAIAAAPVKVAAPSQVAVLPIAQTALPKSAPDTSSMADKFDRASSLRAFHYEAIRTPESGGHFYGIAALFTCKKYGGSAPPAASATPAQQDAFRRMSLRCEMTDQERHAIFSQWAHNNRTSTADTDPMLQRIYDLVGAKSDEVRRQAIGRLLETQDAAVLMTVLSPRDHGDKSETFFKGNWYGGEKGEQTIDMSILLARCTLGTHCGPDSTEYLNLCAQRGWCAGNVSDSIQQGIGSLGIDAAKTRDLANQMVTTFMQQDASAFLPVPEK